MEIQAHIVGSGRAALALERSLALLKVAHPHFHIKDPIRVKRDEKLKPLAGYKNIAIIANPHALHAPRILQAAETGFDAVVAEKPSCTSTEDLEKLKNIHIPVAICHIYRQTWGIQTLKQLITSGELGKIIAIEGRYWQSSTAQRALNKAINISSALSPSSTQSWKNNPALSGPYDVLIDVGTHWADCALFLAGEKPQATSLFLNYANAETAHRDSHVHLRMLFPSGTWAMSSISKTVHGASNHFEINVLGAKKSATWKFQEPDLLTLGEGANQRSLVRATSQWGTELPPFHGAGWMEGYVDILHQIVRQLSDEKFSPYPTLKENLSLMEHLLGATSGA